MAAQWIADAWTWVEESVQRRVAGWSVRRRWVALVAVPVMLCCCGGVVGLPVWWAIRETTAAGQGEASPAAAVVAYVGALGYGEAPPLALLADDTQDRLTEQWTGLQAAMRATDGGGPSRLNIGDMAEGPIVGGRSVVEAEVSATWWGRGGTAGTSLQSEAKTWRITTVDDDGWRVAEVDAPAWCGPGGYVVRCPTDPVPSPAASVPAESAGSPSPSPDMLGGVRDMLPCGPNDPFRNMPGRGRSCPPS